MEENRKNHKTAKIVVITALISCVLTVFVIFEFFIVWNAFGKVAFVETSDKNAEISSKLDEYKTIIDKYFLGEVKEEKLEEGAIRGYIAGLDDPYTQYISKDEMKDFLEDTKGNFVGIGIYMTTDKETNLIKVVETIEDSPAEEVGLKAGDLIKTVDGEIFTAENLDKISSKIKGTEGTKVKLEIIRDKETKEFEIVRRKIIVNQVKGEVLENNIGYIKISSFDEATSSGFKEKYDELNQKNIKGLIIDLRNNGGGIVTEALKVADYITDKGSVLLYEVDKNNKEQIKKSNNDPIVNVPVILLVNENTASASEILAGALKDLGKAKIVGTKTYGKGVIQEVLSRPDGSGLKITTEKYLTPNKTEIHKIGIEPDEKVELPKEITSMRDLNKENDTQLKKALEMLK